MANQTISSFFQLKNVVVATLLFLFNPAYVLGEISFDAWLNKPSIKEVRNVYSEIKRDITNNDIVTFSKIFIYDKYDPLNTDRCNTVEFTIGLDSNANVQYGKLVHLQRDLVITTEYYYDKNRILRFIFVIFDNDKSDTERIYFDRNGKILFALRDENTIRRRSDLGYNRENVISTYITEEQALTLYRTNWNCRLKKPK